MFDDLYSHMPTHRLIEAWTAWLSKAARYSTWPQRRCAYQQLNNIAYAARQRGIALPA